MVLLHSARHGFKVPSLARWLLGLGITATLAANIAHGLGHGPVGALVAAWPAIALVGTYELLIVIVRGAQDLPADVRDNEPVSGDVPEHDPLRVRAVQAFTDELSAGRVPSIREIRSRLRVGQPRAQQIRAYLSSRTQVAMPEPSTSDAA